MVRLEVSPSPCTYKPTPHPIFTKCKTYCLEPPAFQVPDRICGEGTDSLEFALESRQRDRATILVTLGCWRVRWIRRTRMGNAGARESIPIVRDGQPSGRQSHLFVYQLQDRSYVGEVGEVRARCCWGTPCSLSLLTAQVCLILKGRHVMNRKISWLLCLFCASFFAVPTFGQCKNQQDRACWSLQYILYGSETGFREFSGATPLKPRDSKLTPPNPDLSSLPSRPLSAAGPGRRRAAPRRSQARSPRRTGVSGPSCLPRRHG